jgi:hypothetical protein
MPLKLSGFNSGLPQVFDATGKAPVSSAVSPMNQVPQYATSNTSPSASLLSMQQKAPAMSQPGMQFMP